MNLSYNFYNSITTNSDLCRRKRVDTTKTENISEFSKLGVFKKLRKLEERFRRAI